jgi:Lon protease-like protein
MAMNKTYLQASDLPEAIPVFPLSGAILLPGGQLPLNIFEPRYLAMFDDAMRGERIIGIVQPEGGVDGGPGETPALRNVGAAGRITQLSETGDGRYFAVLSGIARFRLVAELDAATPYRQARVDFDSFAEDFAPDETVSSGRRENLNVVAFDLAQALKLDIARKDIEAGPSIRRKNRRCSKRPNSPPAPTCCWLWRKSRCRAPPRLSSRCNRICSP